MSKTRGSDQRAAFTQGLTFNLGDEAAAGLIAARTAIDNAAGRGRGYTPRQAYDARMAVEAARRAAYEKAHPIESQVITGAGEVVQGFIPFGQVARGAKAVMVGGKTLKAAVAAEKARSRIIAGRRAYETVAHAARREAAKGAASGAVSGWAGAKPGERTSGAVTGAVSGYLVGRATPYVEQGVKKGAQTVVRSVTGTPLMPRASRQAANVIEESIRADGVSPRWVRTPQEPSLPMEAAGENLKTLAVTAANAPGPARHMALDAIAERQAAFPQAPLTAIDVDPAPAFSASVGGPERVDALFHRAPLRHGLDLPEGRLESAGLDARLQQPWRPTGDLGAPAEAWSADTFRQGFPTFSAHRRSSPPTQGFADAPAAAYPQVEIPQQFMFARPVPSWQSSTRGILPEPTLFGGTMAQAPQHLLPLLSDRATNARLGESLFGDPANFRRLLDQKSGQRAYDQVDRWAPKVVSFIDDMYGTDDQIADLLEWSPPPVSPKPSGRR